MGILLITGSIAYIDENGTKCSGKGQNFLHSLRHDLHRRKTNVENTVAGAPSFQVKRSVFGGREEDSRSAA